MKTRKDYLEWYWNQMVSVVKTKNPSLLLQLDSKIKKTVFKWFTYSINYYFTFFKHNFILFCFKSLLFQIFFVSLFFLLISVVKSFLLHCFHILTLFFVLLNVDLTGVSNFINCDQFIKITRKRLEDIWHKIRL